MAEFGLTVEYFPRELKFPGRSYFERLRRRNDMDVQQPFRCCRVKPDGPTLWSRMQAATAACAL